MANIREIQSRINSVKDTMKITNAMYMISSSKMTHAKKKLADTEPYFYGLQGEISRILRHLPDLHHGYFSARSCHIRDPKVYKEGEFYYMVLGARDVHSKGMVLLYRSMDL